MKLYTANFVLIMACHFQSIAPLNKSSNRNGRLLAVSLVSYSASSTKYDVNRRHYHILRYCRSGSYHVKRSEFINTKANIVSCMSSSQSSSPPPLSSEVEELRTRVVREQVDLYRQLREQLINQVKRYQKEGNHKLANIISESLRE